MFGKGHCGPSHGGGHCGPQWAGHHGGPFGGGGRGWHGGPPGGGQGDFDGDGGGFGVRRPLRFLAWKLELEEEQVAKLAIVLDELKTERAQAAVDQRRSIAAFADAVGGSAFDAAKAKEAGDMRVKTAERLREAVLGALEKMHALLDDEQRQRLAYLLRTGALVI
jgi:Spy/CpxP family protein refolding chaperone